jgi:hypothetical protein
VQENSERNKKEMDNIGNLVFFQSYGSSLYQQATTRLVQWGTKGQFVHVAIVIDTENGCIEAANKGIRKALLPHDRTTYTMVSTMTVNKDEKGIAHALDPDRLARAVEWALSQINVEYSYADIFSQAVDIIAPWNSLQLSKSGTYDCSNFATAFLDKAGVWLPDSFKEPYNVSPNDLAEWYGLLPERHRVR